MIRGKIAKKTNLEIKDYPMPKIDFNPVIPPIKRIKDKTNIKE